MQVPHDGRCKSISIIGFVKIGVGEKEETTYFLELFCCLQMFLVGPLCDHEGMTVRQGDVGGWILSVSVYRTKVAIQYYGAAVVPPIGEITTIHRNIPGMCLLVWVILPVIGNVDSRLGTGRATHCEFPFFNGSWVMRQAPPFPHLQISPLTRYS